jgi:hypothetical protein
MPRKIKVQALAADTRNGTNSFACLTDDEAIDWFVQEIGYDRDDYDEWKKTAGEDAGVFDFAEEHADDLATFSWEEVELEIPDA